MREGILWENQTVANAEQQKSSTHQEAKACLLGEERGGIVPTDEQADHAAGATQEGLDGRSRKIRQNGCQQEEQEEHGGADDLPEDETAEEFLRTTQQAQKNKEETHRLTEEQKPIGIEGETGHDSTHEIRPGRTGNDPHRQSQDEKPRAAKPSIEQECTQSNGEADHCEQAIQQVWQQCWVHDEKTPSVFMLASSRQAYKYISDPQRGGGA